MRAPRLVVRSRLIAAVLLALPAALLVLAGMARDGHDRDLDHRGKPVTAVVVASSRGFLLPDRALIRYDIDDGSIVRADVWVVHSALPQVGDTVAATYDPRHPTRARIFPKKDPLLPYVWGAAAVLLAAALAFLATAIVLLARTRRLPAGEGVPMRATAWERKRRGGAEPWVSLARPGSAAEELWVPLWPGADVSALGAPGGPVLVRGVLRDGERLVVDAGGTLLPSRGRARAEMPSGLSPASETRRSVPRAPTIIAVVAVVLVLALIGATAYFVAGPGGRGVIDRAADRRGPACKTVEGLLPGRSSKPGPTDTGEATDADVSALPQLIFNRPPDNIGFPNDVVPGESLTVQDAAQSRRDPEEGMRVLTRYGYVGGYRRDFTGPNATSLTEFAYVFSSPQNALAFDAYASRYLCFFDESVFSVPGIPGAVGHRFKMADGSIVAQVSFVQGTQRFLVGLTNVTAGPRGRDAIVIVARLAYDRVQRRGDLAQQPTPAPKPKGQKPPRKR
jgi:hypothetical protein